VTDALHAAIVPFPPETVQRYRAAGLWGSRTIAEEFRQIALGQPDRPALIGHEMALTYRQLDARADHIGAGLSKLGIAPGDRVLLQVTNTWEAIAAWYGLLKAGAVPVCTLPQHREHEICEIARQCEPVAHLVQADYPGCDLVDFARRIAQGQDSLRWLLTLRDEVGHDGTVALEGLRETDDAQAGRIVDAVQATISPDSLAVLQLSGGTTSVPKLIPRLNAEYWCNARLYADCVGITAQSRVAHLLPIVHNAGIACALHAGHSVGALVLAAGLSDAFAETAREAAITHLLLTRPVAQRLVSDPDVMAALQTMRCIMWADKNVPEFVCDAFETDECRILQMFGMGEGMFMVTPFDAPPEVRHTSVGVPMSPYDEVRIHAPGTEDVVGPGEHGELCCRGPYTIRGYYRAAERNATAFTSEGYYRTGDIIRQTEVAGMTVYRLEDRIKDVISRGGEKINVTEVEQLLAGHPSIEAVAIVSMPDDRLGERACAFVVAHPGSPPLTVTDLAAYLDARKVAKFKWPERVECRTSLPHTNITKVNRVRLREEIRDILAAEAGRFTER
jgi:non-ribosomal peptide synthetase component E (peptide arylation enzyme)